MTKKSGTRRPKPAPSKDVPAGNCSNRNSKPKTKPNLKAGTKETLQAELAEARSRLAGADEELRLSSNAQLDFVEAKNRVEELERQVSGQALALQNHALELEARNEELRTAQEQLEAFRRRLADEYDFAPVAYLTLDANALVCEANVALTDLLGVEKIELIDKPFSRFIAELDDAHVFTAHTRETFSSLKRHACELKLRRTDDRSFYARLESMPSEIRDGKAGRIRTTVSDITKHRRTEEALKNSLSRFELLAGTAADLLHAGDPGRVVEPACRKVMEYLGCDVFLYYAADEKAGKLHLSSHAGVSAAEAGQIEWFDYGEGVCGCVARDGCRIVAEHISTRPDPQTELIRSLGIMAYACHPLYGFNGRVAGTLAFGTRRRRTFTARDLDMMKAVVDQIAIALVKLGNEQALSESEERYRLLVEVSPDAILIHDGRTFLFVNSAAVLLLGFKSPEKLIGLDIFSVLHPDFHEVVRERIAAMKSAVGILPREIKMLRSDGTAIDVESMGTPMVLKGRQVFHIVIRDITERKRAEQALQQSNRLLDAVVNSTHLLMACLDPRFNFIWVNRAYADADERTPDYFPGKNHFALYPSEENEAIFRSVVATGKPFFIEAKPFEYKGHPERGVSYWDWGLVPLVDDRTGKVDKLVFTLLNVTGRKRAEQQIERLNQDLQRRVDELETFFKTVPIGISIAEDPEGRRIRGNRANEQMLGVPEGGEFSKREPGGARFKVFQDGRELTLEELPMQRAVRGETVTGQVIDVVREDGRIITLYSSAAPLFDEEGRPRGAVGSFTDITDRKRSEEKISHQNSLLEGINLIFRKSMTCDSEEDLGRLCLEVAEKVTGSRFGFIGKVGSDGLLHNLVISDPGWEQCRMHDKTGHRRPPGIFKIHGLYGRVLAEGKSFFTNAPAAHEDSIGLPAGHPSLTAFLGAPLTHAGKTIGILGLGNREGGYGARDQEAVDALAAVMVQVFLRLRAEDGLRKNQDQLREYVNLLEYAPLMVRNMQEEIILWNKGMERIYGYSPADAIGQKEHQLLKTQFPQPLPEILKTVERKGKWEGEVKHVTRDGRAIAVSSLWVLHKSSDGESTSIIEINSDISDRRRAEEELRRLNEELESRVKERTSDLAATVGALQTEISDRIRAEHALRESEANLARAQSIAHIGSWSYDLLSEKTACSEELYKIFGLNANDVNGNMQSIVQFVHPDDREKVSAGIRQIVTRSRIEPLECRIIPPDGRKRVIWGMAETVFDKKGKPLLILGTVQDITDRKRADEELIRLVTAIESAADALVVTEPVRGMIQYVNPAFEKITGYTREEVLGRDIHVLESGRHDEEFFRKLREALRKDGVWTGRMVHKKKDGSLYEEECTYSPVKNSSGEIINYISIKRDVTEKVRLESIAQAVDTMNNLGYIFAGVSHEVGNPVNAIGMNLNIIKKKLNQLPKEKIAEYVDRAAGQLARVQYLLSSLKNFNMYENLQFQPVQAASFFEIFLAMVKKDFEAKGVAVEFRLDPDCPMLYADPRALQQVLLNIVTNACDALEERRNPQITITVTSVPEYVKICVSDNGRGIEEARIKDLFKPFHTTKKHGTGLGLVIIKKMVARMNGTVAIDSRINEGTTVELCLPYEKAGNA